MDKTDRHKQNSDKTGKLYKEVITLNNVVMNLKSKHHTKLIIVTDKKVLQRKCFNKYLPFCH